MAGISKEQQVISLRQEHWHQEKLSNTDPVNQLEMKATRPYKSKRKNMVRLVKFYFYCKYIIIRIIFKSLSLINLHWLTFFPFNRTGVYWSLNAVFPI